MTIRPATDDDRATLGELYRAFFAEVPQPPYEHIDLEHELSEVDDMVRDDVALLAEEDGEAVGFVLAKLRPTGAGYVTDLYVKPEARRGGVARELMREAGARLRDAGATAVQLDVQATNAGARAFYERLGFATESLRLWVDPEELERRTGDRRREVYGTVHVQSDDYPRVEAAARAFVRRLGHSERTDVLDPENGWIVVVDELAGRDPDALRRLARELSDRLGGVALSLGVEDEVVRFVLFDRGRVMDEYLSVPTYFGELPPGDVVALAANPTVVARLTGADPHRVREVARTADSPSELPPAGDLYRGIAEVMGLTLPTA